MNDFRIKSLIRNDYISIIPFALFLTSFIALPGYWLYVLEAGIVFTLAYKKKIFIDAHLFWIVLFYLAYIYFHYFHNFQYNLTSWNQEFFATILLYIYGRYLVNKYNQHRYFIVKITLLVIILFSITPFFSNVLDVINNGFMTDRNIDLIWDKSEENLAATNVGSYFSLSMSLIMVLLFKRIEIKSIKKISIIIFVTGVFSTLNMINRTGFYISILSIISVLYIVPFREKIGFGFRLSIYTLIIVFLILFFDFGDVILNSKIFYRLFHASDVVEGNLPRTAGWAMAIYGLFKFPFGGELSTVATTFAHNLWLDVGRKVGIIPLVILLVVSFNYLFIINNLIRAKKLLIITRAFIISISVGFFGTFMVEPIIYGYKYFFMLFFFFYGMFYELALSKLLKEKVKP